MPLCFAGSRCLDSATSHETESVARSSKRGGIRRTARAARADVLIRTSGSVARCFLRNIRRWFLRTFANERAPAGWNFQGMSRVLPVAGHRPWALAFEVKTGRLPEEKLRHPIGRSKRIRESLAKRQRGRALAHKCLQNDALMETVLRRRRSRDRPDRRSSVDLKRKAPPLVGSRSGA